jgi:hypothetical protein
MRKIFKVIVEETMEEVEETCKVLKDIDPFFSTPPPPGILEILHGKKSASFCPPPPLIFPSHTPMMKAIAI